MNLLSLIWMLGACQESTPQKQIPVSQEPENPIEKRSELGPVKVNVRVWPTEPKLGDSIQLVLRVEGQDKVEVDMPPFGEALGQFQIVDYQPRASRTNTNIYEQHYTLQASMSGLQTIPSLRVVFRDKRTPETAEEEKELLSEEIVLPIQSLLDEDAPLDFKAAKSNLAARVEVSPWVWVAGGILGVGLIGGFIISRLRQQQHEEMRLDPYDAALGALSALENQADISDDNFYEQLSMVLRRYIEERFELMAVERTTPEIITLLKDNSALQEHKAYIKACLSYADEVKYAQLQPPQDKREGDIAELRRFLKATYTPQEEA